MTVKSLSYKLAGVDAQSRAEEAAFYQNKAHSSRWHCRIGKISIWSDETINMQRLLRETRNDKSRSGSYKVNSFLG